MICDTIQENVRSKFRNCVWKNAMRVWILVWIYLKYCTNHRIQLIGIEVTIRTLNCVSSAFLFFRFRSFDVINRRRVLLTRIAETLFHAQCCRLSQY